MAPHPPAAALSDDDLARAVEELAGVYMDAGAKRGSPPQASPFVRWSVFCPSYVPMRPVPPPFPKPFDAATKPLLPLFLPNQVGRPRHRQRCPSTHGRRVAPVRTLLS